MPKGREREVLSRDGDRRKIGLATENDEGQRRAGAPVTDLLANTTAPNLADWNVRCRAPARML